MLTELQLTGIASFLLGMTIRYLIHRRRFNRRGVGGLEHFRSYERAVFTRFIEWIFRLIGIFLVFFGIFLFIRDYFIKV